VLLKGTPTVVFSPTGERFVSATGTAALATGGSGDVLTGIIGTLAAQMCRGTVASHTAAEAAACGAFVHGRAAELCGDVRGTTLADILDAMPRAWKLEAPPLGAHVIATVRGVS
jgi:NAD(P)H-hydrate repair Nnr-like enzyme with NAD(P)H-hydrate dehydratase domain